MAHERNTPQDKVQAYRLENETLKTKLAEVNKELSMLREIHKDTYLLCEIRDKKITYYDRCLERVKQELKKAREEVEDLKRAYGEVCAVQEAERLERGEAAASTEKKAENLGLIVWGKL